ncbi:MAG: ComF family protein, partial [Clostridia bacterium]|nr:ComF family protein [Clostridia bacterium]
MSTNFGSLLSRLFVAEYNCIVCGGELHRPNRYRLCGACYGMRFEVLREKACLKCGKMLLAEEEYCLDCQNHEKHFDRAISAVTYTEAAVSLVTALKFRGKKYLADPMAKWMTDRFLELEIAADLVIPVPLHPNRRKERGYNQSELLAEVIA